MDGTSNNEYSNEDDYSYYLLNKGMDLQKQNKKRTHSVKKALGKFIYKSNVIEKIKANLYSLELRKNDKIDNNTNKNNSDKKEAKFGSRIYDIVKKIANSLNSVSIAVQTVDVV